MPEEKDSVIAELDLGEPPEEILETAKKEIHEYPETRAQVLQEFRDMIFEQGECVPHRTDDAFILRFLRARNFHLESAHRLFVNYYLFKENNPEFFDGVEPLELTYVGDDDIISVPPYREQTGRRLMIYRLGKWNPEKIGTDELFQATLCILELAILEQRAQILGGVAIFDLGDLTMAHAWQITPGVAAKMVQIMVTSFPMKIKAIHILNQSWVFDVVYNIFKPLLDHKMRQRIFFHGEDMESLHQHVDPKHLPQRYGGVHLDYSYNDWINSFKKNPIILKEMRSLGYVVNDEDEATDSDGKNEEKNGDKVIPV